MQTVTTIGLDIAKSVFQVVHVFKHATKSMPKSFFERVDLAKSKSPVARCS